ncbi:MAG: hypothetical protein HC892_01460 [Saprospiraceae bacterium]|nr:hypothetical protein [Saprospiraceae bacterium]
MFNNLSFEIKQIEETSNSNPLVDTQAIVAIVDYIANKGKEISTIKGLAESVSKDLFIFPIDLSLTICKQIFQIRNLCANWMNLNSNVGDDITDNTILNTVAPNSISELQNSVWWSSNRWYVYEQSVIDDGSGNAIQNLDESLRPNFDAIVEAVIAYSRFDADNNPIGDWDYYKDAIKLDYNFDAINNQLG